MYYRLRIKLAFEYIFPFHVIDTTTSLRMHSDVYFFYFFHFFYIITLELTIQQQIRKFSSLIFPLSNGKLKCIFWKLICNRLQNLFQVKKIFRNESTHTPAVYGDFNLFFTKNCENKIKFNWIEWNKIAILQIQLLSQWGSGKIQNKHNKKKKKEIFYFLAPLMQQ